MKTFIVSYFVSGIVFLGLDAVWLSIMGTPLYRAQLGNLMLEKFLLPPAIAFYLAYPVGIAVFAVGPVSRLLPRHPFDTAASAPWITGQCPPSTHGTPARRNASASAGSSSTATQRRSGLKCSNNCGSRRTPKRFAWRLALYPVLC